jgi:hypothetical protein
MRTPIGSSYMVQAEREPRALAFLEKAQRRGPSVLIGGYAVAA